MPPASSSNGGNTRSNKISIVWFRRDLRVEDNPALAAGVRAGHVVSVFIWAPEEEGHFFPGRVSRWWLSQSLKHLDSSLRSLGAHLITKRSFDTASTLVDVVNSTGATSLFFNHLYDPLSLVRDHRIKELLSSLGVTVHSFNADLLYEPWEIADENGSPFLTFEPFWNKCLNMPYDPAAPLLPPKMITSECDFFYLLPLNRQSVHHRRSVAACLVQSVYILERDRQEHHEEAEALAPAWWESFYFELNRKLIDDTDFSIFGAIFEYKPPTSIVTVANAPRFVIAFRGTITKTDSVDRDLTLDLHLIKNSLHQTTRFELAMQAVRNLVSTVGGSNIWIAGHSLGSALASLAARNMAKTGILLEAYLFNPPFFSAPIERIKNQRVKHGIRIASSVVTAGLSFVLKGQQERSTLEDPFVALSSWVPNLFVNPKDHICSEYIGYFEHRKNMEDLGVGIIEKLATQNSLGDIFLRSLGKESEPLHLLPSANLTINLSPSPDFKWAHGIHQWWRPDLHLQTKTYIYS